MRGLGALALAGGILVAMTRLDGQTPPLNAAEKQLVGTWRLVKYDQGGKPAPSRGPKPTGIIVYDGRRNMSVQIMPDRKRPKFAGSEPTPEEAKEALYGYIAYFGTFEINESAQTVTHHRQGNIDPGGVGVDFVRKYRFETPDRVVLSPVEGPARDLTWERVK